MRLNPFGTTVVYWHTGRRDRPWHTLVKKGRRVLSDERCNRDGARKGKKYAEQSVRPIGVRWCAWCSDGRTP